MSQSLSNEQQFFADIARILQTGRSQAYQAVNTAMVQTYWQLGQRIVEQEQQGEARAEYGKALITNLSRYLGDTFGKGFSVANLKNFRQFYLTYPDFDELATQCVANLSWSHVRLIMRLENPAERSYYLLKCFVVIDLKTEKLTHQDIGQMDMYIRMFDDLKRGEDDNPTLGIILCADKDETLVHYSVLSESKQLFASKYQTMLPTEEELAAMLEQDLQRSLGDKNE